jgi:hypothetical protein
MKLGLARGKWMLKRSRFMKRSSTPITVRVGRREFVKLNVTKYDWRDIYNFILTLSWPQFAGLFLGIYVLFNLCFATLYLLGERLITQLEMTTSTALSATGRFSISPKRSIRRGPGFASIKLERRYELDDLMLQRNAT